MNKTVIDETSIKTLKQNYGVTETDLKNIAEVGKKVIPSLKKFIADFYVRLEKLPEFGLFFSDAKKVAMVKSQQVSYWEGFFQAKVDEEYVMVREKVGTTHANINLPLESYFSAMNFSSSWFINFVAKQKIPEQKKLDYIQSISKLVHFDTAVVVTVYQKQTDETIAREQSKAIQELSTPAIKILDGIVLLPLIGIVDTSRSSQLLERLLNAIVTHEVKVAIIDITGVPLIDTSVAHSLIKTISASRMLGAEVIITGISPSTAQTLTKLNINLLELRTEGNLQTGIAKALFILGKDIVAIGNNNKNNNGNLEANESNNTQP